MTNDLNLGVIMESYTLKEYLKHIINNELLDSYLPEIINSFALLQLKKNDYFVKEGAVEKCFGYIESGVLQHSITVLGEEKTTYLALKNSCVSSLKSFLKKTPSRKNIKALSDCRIWSVNYEVFNNLITTNKAFHTFYFNLIENQIFLIDDYRIDLLTLTAEERYYKLLVNEPNLLQEVPLHYLASFLGISSRHMSRIRKNIK